MQTNPRTTINDLAIETIRRAPQPTPLHLALLDAMARSTTWRD